MNSAVTLVDFDRLLNGLDHECDAFKQHIAAESQTENQGEGESCDS